MTVARTKHYTIEVLDKAWGGYSWVVRVYRERLFWKEVVMSDWFLDREQALEYANKVVHLLDSTGNLEKIKSRSPGWTLN
jgi:hypothetical protein